MATASTFVIPQNLEASTQKIKLDVHITTHLSNGLVIEENFTPTIDIKDISSLSAWKMNQNVTYSFNFAPSLGSTTDTVNSIKDLSGKSFLHGLFRSQS